MFIHKLSNNKSSLYVKMLPESGGRRGNKMDPKRDALFEVKLLSCDKGVHIPYKIHIHIFHYDTTCDFKHHLKKANEYRYIPKV